MNENFNSQEETFGGMEGAYDGEQESVVDSLESQDSEDFGFADDGHEEDVDSQDDGGNEEGSDEGDKVPAFAEQGGAKRQTRADNSAARLARLHAKRETDEEIARMGLRNPSTGELIRNMTDLKAFSAQRRDAEVQIIAKRTGRNAKDILEELENRDFVSQLRASAKANETASTAAAAAASKSENLQAFIAKDAHDFMAKHPNVDIAKLGDNRQFREFCGSRFGKEPLAGLYESYLRITGAAANAGRAGAQSRRNRSTGSGGGGGDVLTPSQRARLDEWNRDNPDMKMTAKEFLGK